MQHDTLFAILPHQPQQHLQHQPRRPRRTSPGTPRTPADPDANAPHPTGTAIPDETAVGYSVHRKPPFHDGQELDSCGILAPGLI